MELDSFLDLEPEEIASLVKSEGPKVCVCPINGTRRWYFLEYGLQENSNYLKVLLGKYIEIFQIFFSHGIDTVLTPIFGPELLSRGEAYVDLAVQGMKDIVTDAEFLDFAKTYQVRVRFYGDYVRHFHGTRFEFLIALFERLTQETKHHSRYRLLWGVFANDATEQIAKIGAKFYVKNHRYPLRRDIVEAYYGEFIDPVSLFIGFDKFSAFDMPILATGEEDYYFTTDPLPYLTEKQFRMILYDHLYARKGDPDYLTLSEDAREHMRHFYAMNRENTMGVGVKNHGVWYPLSQVTEIS